MDQTSLRPAARPSERFRLEDKTVTPDRSATFACALILVVMAVQAAFLLIGCEWDVSADEAEYWTWSRKLDWSYYAKGPLIAWLMRLSSELLGGLSMAVDGSMMPALRLPAVLLGGLTAWGIFRLASETTGRPRVGLIAVALMPSIPIFALGAVVMTIDTPLVCAWTWAAVWTYRGVTRDKTAPWVYAGLIGSLGVMAKYTQLAFPAAVGTFLLFSPSVRRQLIRPGFWLMSAITGIVGMAPIVAWNVGNQWVALWQLTDRLGIRPHAPTFKLSTLFSFWAGEAAALAPGWWVVGAIVLVRTTIKVLRPKADEQELPGRDARLYLLGLWAVLWAACTFAALKGETEVNWMAPGYVPLVVLIAARIDWLGSRNPRAMRPFAWLAAGGVALTVFLHHTEWIYSAVASSLPAETPTTVAPMRVFDPTCRMRGHRQLAEAVDQAVKDLQAKGEDPFVLTPVYPLASLLTFYMPGNPETYCVAYSPAMDGFPLNQHDLWHPNPRNDVAAFAGRTAVVVEDAGPIPNYGIALKNLGIADGCETPYRIKAVEHGVVVGAWDVTIVRGYRGLPKVRR